MIRRHHTLPRHRPSRDQVAAEIRALQLDARRRYTEVDLLVAALRDHIRDLQAERDRLRAEIDRLQDDARRQSATWLWRGSKPNRA